MLKNADNGFLSQSRKCDEKNVKMWKDFDMQVVDTEQGQKRENEDSPYHAKSFVICFVCLFTHMICHSQRTVWEHLWAQTTGGVR